MQSGGGMKNMKRTGIVIAVGAFFCLGAAAQPQSGAQAGAQSGSQASAEAGKTKAQASGNASAATSASAQNGQENASLASGTALNAALNSSIDSKKCKPGDAVNAHTTEAVKSEGKTVIPKGSKLVGHVTQASARAKGVVGLNGLNLSTAASNATQGSVITSAGKNVHLDGGTRMLLVSQAQAGDQGESKQPAASKPEPKSAPKSEPNKPNKQ